ncbi:MAG: hypothetical protein ACLSE8_04355 [Parasutterella sp.]
MTNTAVRNTSVERVDSLESMAEALQLFPWAMTTRSLETPFLIFLSNFFEIIVKHQDIGWQREKPKGLFSTKPSIATKDVLFLRQCLNILSRQKWSRGFLINCPKKE